MAGIPETVPVSASQGQDARTSSDPQASAPASPPEDFRVRCTLKRAVVEVMELCGRFVQELGAALPEDIRELALRDAQWVRTGPSFPPLTLLCPAPQTAGCPRLAWEMPGKATKMPVPLGCFLSAGHTGQASTYAILKNRRHECAHIF